MGWAKFPLNGGAVNSRTPSELKPGEFSETSGVRYRPGSDRLWNDLVYSDWGFRPDDLGTNYSDWYGPFYLSFEDTNDWIMLVVNRTYGISDTGDAPVEGQIFFARADGSANWIQSGHVLTDNAGNQNGLTAASITHWGDRYYLVTDQGCAEIAPPGGTGIPLVRPLGLHVAEGELFSNGYFADKGYPRFPSMMQFATAAAQEFLGGSDPGTISWLTDSGSSILTSSDRVTLYFTEYDKDSGVESQPIYQSVRNCSADNEYPSIRLPAATANSEADSFRVYFRYEGVDQDANQINARLYERHNYLSAVTGAFLLYAQAGFGSAQQRTEFEPGDTVNFTGIGANNFTNPLPTLGVDGARAIYSPYRAPNTSTTCAVWNDSLVLNDTGYDRDEDVYDEDPTYGQYAGNHGRRREKPAKTILRYSPAGDPANQPVPYFMNFASEREDQIKGLQVVNDRLIVLCDQAVHTLRYLPFNNLLAAQQGRVKDVITTNVGLASPKAVTKVETQRGEMCVWLSRRGLEWTDGSGWDDACPDFDIPDGVDPSQAVLVTLPNEYRVDLYLGTKLYSFYYHPDHLKNGRMKMLGPTELGKIIYGACEYRGVVYRWDGVDIEWTGVDTTPVEGYVYTGYIYGENPFKDLVIEDFGLTHEPVDGSISVRCDAAVLGQALQNGSATELSNPEIEETGLAGVSQRGNYVRFRVAVTSSDDWSVGPLWVQGDEESGGLG